jgi:NAD+ synthase (glutamine-hydrolysing)
MSHYAVNASVPKTLIQHIIRWGSETGELGEDASRTLLDVLETEISPELIPHTGPEDLGASQPSQSTEAKIGPYELHDFSLYYTLRFGYAPPKVAFLAYTAWRDAQRGTWPGIPEARRRQYALGQIKSNLGVFLDRFFRLSQFKRSCIPNGPKVGSGGSLSPRGDYRAPSDGEATAWLQQLERIPGDE